MGERLFKQFLYGFFFFLVWAVFFYGIYLLSIKPPPSCFDNIKNQREVGLDCGGPCAKICLPANVRKITSGGQAQLFILPSGLVGALFVVENPNSDYAVSDLVYSLNVYDGGGSLLKTITGHSFIYGEEIKYIASPALSFGTSTPARAEFKIKDPVWIKTANFRRPDIKIQSSASAIQGENVQITGRVLNQDIVAFPFVKIVAVLSYDFGNQAGVSETQLENLLPGEVRDFTIFHPALLDLNLLSTQLFVYALRP
ncbi:MAG: hypothetical protein Q7S36_03625 [Candidatus Liptonbacteria bacterium]|nr:hypothetical protein [Candidatus Liptonbacteria bacterium]